MSRHSSQQHGVLILNKPQGPTSSACVQDIKKRLKQPKIGHAGTLDPLATGVLVILLGQGTKLAPYLSAGSKTYTGHLELGKETDTYDIQGNLIQERSWTHLSPEEVQGKIMAWSELKEQTVPPYSAAKHKGKPLYALSRAGKEVPVKTKPVSIDQVQVVHVDLPTVIFRVRCSPGTYVRSLAHSLGKRLGCGAVLTSLNREETSPFSLDQAHSLQSVLDEPEGLPDKVLSLEESLRHWPRLLLTWEQRDQVRNGTWLAALDCTWQPGGPGEQALLLSPEGGAEALVESRMHRGRLHWAILRGLWSGR